MARMAPSFAPLIRLSVMRAVPAERSMETPMDEIVRDADVAEIAAPADGDAEAWSILDDVAAHHGVGLDGNAVAARTSLAWSTPARPGVWVPDFS